MEKNISKNKHKKNNSSINSKFNIDTIKKKNIFKDKNVNIIKIEVESKSS